MLSSTYKDPGSSEATAGAAAAEATASCSFSQGHIPDPSPELRPLLTDVTYGGGAFLVKAGALPLPAASPWRVSALDTSVLHLAYLQPYLRRAWKRGSIAGILSWVLWPQSREG